MARGLPVALWFVAAVISGFTMRRYLEPFDEGLLLQAASRMADGQWPYADFGWAYGPGQPLAVTAAFELFEPSVAWWRVLRVAADATIALLVWILVRREAGPRWALAGWLAAAVTIAQPTSANPVPVALAFALAAVATAAGGEPTTRRAAAAGVLAALAAFWRPDFGVVTVLAVLAVYVARRDSSRASAPAALRDSSRAAAVAAGTAALVAVLLYAPFAVAAGPGRLWDSLVSAGLRDGSAWRLPFPLEYDGPLRGWPPDALAEDLKDLLGFYLPLIGVAALVLVAVLLLRRRPAPRSPGSGCWRSARSPTCSRAPTSCTRSRCS